MPVCLFPDRRLQNCCDRHFLLWTSIACMHGPDGAGPWKGTAGHTILGYGFGPVNPSHALPWLRRNDNAGVAELSRDVPAAETQGSNKFFGTTFQRKQKAPRAPFSGHSPKTEHRKHGVLLLALTHSSHHHCPCLPLNSSRYSEAKILYSFCLKVTCKHRVEKPMPSPDKHPLRMSQASVLNELVNSCCSVLSSETFLSSHSSPSEGHPEAEHQHLPGL